MSVRLCVKEDKMIIEKKPFSFLLPAVLTVALIFHMLPQTQAMLREIPEKLALVAEAERMKAGTARYRLRKVPSRTAYIQARRTVTAGRSPYR